MTLIEATASGLTWRPAAARFPPRSVPAGREMRPEAPAVHIVGLDEDARLLSRWVGAVGLCSHGYAALRDFMQSDPCDAPGCLVIDAATARAAYTDLATFMQRVGGRCPIVMTAYGADIPTAVLAMQTGAVDFVQKPFRQPAILLAIEAAIRVDRERRQAASRRAELRARLASLSPRERQVMALVTAGLLNKQIAGELGVSEVTVKVHRGAVMRKMGVRTLADLVRMADAIADAA